MQKRFWTETQCLFFGFVRFLFTLQFSQSQNLSTMHMIAKIVKSLDKRSGAGKAVKKKNGGKVKVNNPGYPADCTRSDIDLFHTVADRSTPSPSSWC